MTDKELDELFKQSFNRHKMPVPDDMWQRIQPQNGKKRRAAFLWRTGFGLLAIIVLLTAVTWMYAGGLFNFNNLKKAAISAQNKNSHADSVSFKSEKEEPLSKKTAALRNQEISAAASSKQITHKTFQRNTMSDSDTSLQRMADYKSNAFAHRPKNKDYVTATSANGYGNSDSTMVSNNIKTELFPESIDDKSFHEGNDAKKDAMTSTKDSFVTLKKKHDDKAAKLDIMMAGYVGNRSIYEAKENPLPVFVSLRNPKEKAALLSYSVNVRIEKPVSKNLSVTTGLQFLQTYQSVTYNQQAVNNYAFVSSLSFTADTTRFTQISFHRPVIKSIYNRLNIPLLLGYHTSGANINAGISGGVLLNLASWYKGNVPDGDYQKTIAAKNAFRWNTGASLYAGLQVSKNVGNWQLFAEPHIQYPLSSLTKHSVSFKQKITNYGVGIGVKKPLTNK